MRGLLLASVLLLAACDAGGTEGPAVTCASLGTDEDGTLTARLLVVGADPRTFMATCTRATRTADRVVIRALILSGPLVEGEIVLTALGTANGAYAIGGGTASARYIVGGRVYEAADGGITLGTVSATAVTGAFDFSTVGGPSVAGGEFTLPLR